MPRSHHWYVSEKGHQMLGAAIQLTFRTTAFDYPGISPGGKLLRRIGCRKWVGRRAALVAYVRSDDLAA